MTPETLSRMTRLARHLTGLLSVSCDHGSAAASTFRRVHGLTGPDGASRRSAGALPYVLAQRPKAGRSEPHASFRLPARGAAEFPAGRAALFGMSLSP